MCTRLCSGEFFVDVPSEWAVPSFELVPLPDHVDPPLRSLRGIVCGVDGEAMLVSHGGLMMRAPYRPGLRAGDYVQTEVRGKGRAAPYDPPPVLASLAGEK